jgi:hypothetical protein
MVKTRKERAGNASIKLRQPDRSGPSEKTLLEFADERKLFEQVQQRERELAKEKKRRRSDAGNHDETEDDDDGDDDPVLSPGAERFLESALWTATIAMLHFTFDVLVQNQYGQYIMWTDVCIKTARAWLGRFSQPAIVFFFIEHHRRLLKHVLTF